MAELFLNRPHVFLHRYTYQCKNQSGDFFMVIHGWGLCDCLSPLSCTQTTAALFLIPQKDICVNPTLSHKKIELINLVYTCALENQ